MTALPDIRIDRVSPVPFYFQLAALLEQEIVRHRWQPGERLPSEAELCSHFGLSRTTVRQALARLEQEGMVTRRKGFGTFVASASPRIWLLQSQEGFFQDEVSRMGRAVASEILDRRIGELPHWAADALGLAPGAEGVVMERLRSVDGKLALCVTDCVPAAYADVVLSGRHPVAVRAAARPPRPRGRRRPPLPRGRARPQAAAPGCSRSPPGDPLIFIESVSWDAQMRPFHCYRVWLRTDRMRIEIQVSKASGRALEGAGPAEAESVPDPGEA